MTRTMRWTPLQCTYLARIKKLPSVERYAHFITQRLAARTAKLAEKPRPWTADPIITYFKFTNVRRAYDRVSQWLAPVYAAHAEAEWIGPYTLLARFLPFIPSLEAIGVPTRDTRLGFTQWRDGAFATLNTRQQRGGKIFTSAYMVVGGASGTHKSKLHWLFKDVFAPIWADGCCLTSRWDTLDALHQRLKTFNGMGDFMTQEVVLDCQYHHVAGHATDVKFYGYAGPGAKRGLNRLAGHWPKQKYKSSRDCKNLMSEWYADIKRMEDFPASWRRGLTVHDVEFTLCEFDKYERVLWGDGFPKEIYAPTLDPVTQGELTLEGATP